VEAHSPLGRHREPLTDETIAQIAGHDKTKAQVILRRHPEGLDPAAGRLSTAGPSRRVATRAFLVGYGFAPGDSIMIDNWRPLWFAAIGSFERRARCG
jgi:hypothetical protein